MLVSEMYGACAPGYTLTPSQLCACREAWIGMRHDRQLFHSYHRSCCGPTTDLPALLTGGVAAVCIRIL